MGWKNDGREYVPGGKTTGGNMSRVEKQREGICRGWKNDRMENVWGRKMTGGNMS